MNAALRELKSETRAPWGRPGLLAIALLVAAGCDREEIRVYQTPKEPDSVEHAGHTHGESPATTSHAPSMAKPKWTVPGGWEEGAGSGIRVARFTLRGQDGKTGELSVIPLPAGTGREMDVVNIWREELHMQPIGEAEFGAMLEPVRVGDVEGKLCEILSDHSHPEVGGMERITSVMATRSGTTWYFKLKGEDGFVRGQRPALESFLASIDFAVEGSAADGRAPAVSDAEPVAPSAGEPGWDVPAGWRREAAPAMTLAGFGVAGEGGKAGITVTKLASDGGGVLANVNRWRGQLGLGPIGQAEVEGQTQTLDLSDGKAILVDLSGQDARTQKASRMVAAIVLRPGTSWFYKMTGDPAEVEAQKGEFVKFVKSVRY